MKDLKTQLLQGKTLEFSNENDSVSVWFSKTTKRFCIELNSKIIDDLKTFNIFKLKLGILLKQREINIENIPIEPIKKKSVHRTNY